MLLVCDIGNSYISIGLFEGKKLQSNFGIPTNKKARAEDYMQEIRPLIKERLLVKKLVIASVVPEITKEVAQALGLLLEIPPRVLSNKDIPIANKYNQPDSVGVDRLINSYAAIALFKPPLIIIDFGTATTFDVVSSKSEYLGGVIVPGIETSLEALSGKASKLKPIKLVETNLVIGNSTEESLCSGVVLGTAGLVDRLVAEIEKEIGPSTKIATGGLANLIIGHSTSVQIIESHLILKGMASL